MSKQLSENDVLENKMWSQKVKRGIANARAKGVKLGRPKTTQDNLPPLFYEYYPRYKAGLLNKGEYARIIGVTLATVYKYLRIIENEDE